MPHDHYDANNVVHVLHSLTAGLRCMCALANNHYEPAQIILAGTAIQLLINDDDAALHIPEIAGEAVDIIVIASDLPGLGIDLHDLPAYIYLTVDLQTAVQHARQAGHAIHHWL